MQDYVDWFNMMSYDIHGVWDAASKAIGPKLGAHTNLTEIDLGLDLLWRAGVKPEKVVLGQGCKRINAHHYCLIETGSAG